MTRKSRDELKDRRCLIDRFQQGGWVNESHRIRIVELVMWEKAVEEIRKHFNQ